MRIEKLMKKEVALISPKTSISDATKELLCFGEDVAIVGSKSSMQGIVTSYDVLTSLVKKESPTLPITKIMSHPVVSLPSTTDVDEALKIMDTERLRKCPIVRDGEVVGIISLGDIISYRNRNIRFHRNIQNAVIVAFVLFEIVVLGIAFYFGGAL